MASPPKKIQLLRNRFEDGRLTVFICHAWEASPVRHLGIANAEGIVEIVGVESMSVVDPAEEPEKVLFEQYHDARSLLDLFVVLTDGLEDFLRNGPPASQEPPTRFKAVSLDNVRCALSIRFDISGVDSYALKAFHTYFKFCLYKIVTAPVEGSLAQFLVETRPADLTITFHE